MLIDDEMPIQGPLIVSDVSYIYSIKFDSFHSILYGCGGDGLIFKYEFESQKLYKFEGCVTEIWNIIIDET